MCRAAFGVLTLSLCVRAVLLAALFCVLVVAYFSHAMGLTFASLSASHTGKNIANDQLSGVAEEREVGVWPLFGCRATVYDGRMATRVCAVAARHERGHLRWRCRLPGADPPI